MSKFLFPFRKVAAQSLRDAVNNRVVLITGASFGIGQATAYHLAQAGANVILVGRTADKLHEIAQNIIAQGGQAWAFATDLTQSEQVDQLIHTIVAQFPRIDVLISNAGKSIRRSLALSLTRPQDFERTIGVNYLGAVRLIMGVLPVMQKHEQGHLIDISSVSVRLPPTPRWGAYHASKAAFDIWFRSAAPELKTHNIVCSSIYLPLVNTRMIAPTPRNTHTPMLTVHDVAHLIASAIVRQKTVLAPWWLSGLDALSVLFRRPIAYGMFLYFKHSKDSPAVLKINKQHDKDEQNN